ncbi:MAG: hypothetical protein AAFP98_08625 [Pseudomonadota bacterium]
MQVTDLLLSIAGAVALFATTSILCVASLTLAKAAIDIAFSHEVNENGEVVLLNDLPKFRSRTARAQNLRRWLQRYPAHLYLLYLLSVIPFGLAVALATYRNVCSDQSNVVEELFCLDSLAKIKALVPEWAYDIVAGGFNAEVLATYCVGAVMGLAFFVVYRSSKMVRALFVEYYEMH